ncbi:alpha-tocopherol transfer protein-like, partial [Rhipicephalus sanguineus]|uniref:alpha-tocopherol transfer protein-like n=1 Tax=Rhipicephalus sanguineus TaxID=34632 RepID=UPI0020C20E8C
SGAWNTDICKLTDFFRVGIVVFEHVLLQEEAQVRGVVLNIDLKGLNVYHLVHYTPSTIRILISLAQDCVPIGLKGIYVINNPPIFDFFFTIAKTFIKAKLLKRIRLFGYDLKELHQLMPDDVIPEEHGGTNDIYDYDALEKELKSSEGYFQAMGSHGYCDTPTKADLESNGGLTNVILSSEEWVYL